MKLIREIDFIKETIDLTYKVYAPEDVDKDYINRHLEKTPIENINKVLNKYYQLRDNFKKEVDIEDKYIPYFRMSHEKQSILSWFYFKYYINKDLSYDKFLNKFLTEDLLNNKYENQDYKLEEVLLMINSLDIDTDSKLTLINFYVGGKSLFDELIEIAKKNSSIFMKYYEFVKHDVEKAFEILSDEKNVKKIIDSYIKNQYTGEEEVRLTITNYNVLNLSKFNGKIYINFGLYLKNLLEITNALDSDEENLLITLKSLSDPTRFKILKLIKNNINYANEIAREVNLSAATINHHMTNLVNLRLVKIIIQEEDNKKVFYELNKSRFEELIEFIRRELL